MKEIELNMNEQHKYEVIKKLVETNGNRKRAAQKLNCSARTVNRLILKYKEKGKAGFVHGNHGRKPSVAFDQDTKEKIISLYISQFSDTNITHFTEILSKTMNISVSDVTVNKWLRERHILSPMARKRTRSNEKKIIRAGIDSLDSQKKKNILKDKLVRLDENDAHPRRPRCKYMGEMIQMDACSMVWIDNHPKWHLHLAVDDASGLVVGAYFDFQETLNGYYQVFRQILENYGIPAMFYTDRRTVFEYRKKKRALEEDDTFTQFSYACHQLGVEIKTTSVAQAKGRIERLNGTFQSRLPVELRIAHVTNIDEANEFLKSYLKEYNSRFALHLNSTLSVFEKQPVPSVINQTLAVIFTRKIDAGQTFRFRNKNYYITNAAHEKQYFIRGTECMIIQCLDKSYYVNIEDKLYLMEEMKDHESVSKNFDVEIKKEEKPKKKYIPPLNHPWKQNSWQMFKSSTQKHLYGTNP